MVNIKLISDFLISNAGINYKKPTNENDEMNNIASSGKSARENFKELGTKVVSEITNYTIGNCSSWVGMNQIIPNYLWIQLKEVGYEKCPSSISLSFKKVEESIFLYVAVEIKDEDATKEDFKRHNKILEIPLKEKVLYYSGDTRGILI